MSLFAKFPPELNNDRTKDGAVEDDHVAINDIVLTIPPSRIVVQKESLNHEFATLRSMYTQKIKSGYGNAVVSMNIRFVGNKEINEKLKPLFAGLRATPFCVCHSNHLHRCLRGLEALNEINDADYFLYRPLALALDSMTVSTVPGAPDSLDLHLELLWFNYTPYMKEWVYRTGDAPFAKGTVFHSDLWRAFYKPFLSDTRLNWPRDPDSDEPAAQLFFREYLSNPSYDASANAAAIDLLTVLKRKPKKTQDFLHKFLKDEDIQWTDQNIWDVFWKKMGKDALTQGEDINEAMRERFNNSGIPDGAITYALEDAGVGNVLQLTARQAYKLDKHPHYRKDDNKIEEALRALRQRQDEIRRFETQQPTTSGSKTSSGYVPLPQFTVTHDYQKQGGVSHTSQLYGRKRKVVMSEPNGIIVEGISVVIKYNLAMIPMMAYRYPTLQYTGGVDIGVTMALNCSNKGAGKINTAYDAIDNMAHKFRMVPQAYQNIWIQNDLLNFLGLTEFITQRIRTDTIEQQPGRSRVFLELSHAPVLTSTQIGSPEVFGQDGVWTTEGIQLAVAHRLHEFTVRVNQRQSWDKSEVDGYMIQSKLDPNDPNKKAIGTLVDRYCKYYNQPLKETFKRLYTNKVEIEANMVTAKYLAGEFKRERGQAPTQDEFKEYVEERNRRIAQTNALRTKLGGSANLSALAYVFFMSIREKDPNFGTIPNVNALQGTLNALENALRGAQKDSLVPGDRGSEQSTAAAAKAQQHARSLRRVGITDPQTDELARQLSSDVRAHIGTFTYLYDYKAGIRKISDDIQLRWLNLPEFKGIAEAIYSSDILKVGGNSYRDFEPQIKSTVSRLQTKYASAAPDLSLYNPDLYLYNSALDGPLVNLEGSGVLNAQTLAKAQDLSTKSYGNAEKRVKNWFQDNYMSSLGGTRNSVPLEQLKYNVDDDAKSRGVPTGSYYKHSIYSDDIFDNTLSASSITKRLIVDERSKAHINRMSQQQMSCNNSVQHSTNFKSHWNGFETGSPYTREADGFNANSQQYGGSRLRLPPPPPGSAMERMVTFLKDYGEACRRVGLGSRWGGRFKTAPRGEENTHEDWRDLGIPGWDPMHVDLKYKLQPNDRKFSPPAKKSRSLEHLQPRFREKAQKIIKMLQEGKDESGQALPSGEKWKPWIVSTYSPRYGSKTSKDSKHKYGLAIEVGLVLTGQKLHSTTVIKNYRREVDRERRRTSARVATRPSAARKSVTSTVTSPMHLAMKEFEKELVQGQAFGLSRAYPAFRLYFIEDDQGERRLGFDDFFNYSAVQSIRIVRDRHIAADLCELYLTNISGVLSNRKFRQEKDPEKTRDVQGKPANENLKDKAAVDTKKENPIASLLLQEGTHFSVYMGYSNNSKDMELVFTGIITELEFMGSEEIVRVLGQSYGIELVQDIKGITKPRTTDNMTIPGLDFWGLGGNAYTGDLLEEMITQPEVLHFGRWTALRPYKTPERDLLTNKFQFEPTPQDDNIFAPPPKENAKEFADGIFFKELRYTIYQTTIWDIFQEMTLRHPNYIASAVPYKERGIDRMTMFFGLPNQLYFARDPDLKESNAIATMQRVRDTLEEKLSGISKEHREKNKADFGGGGRLLPEGWRESIQGTNAFFDPRSVAVRDALKKLRNDRLEYAKERGYIRPFRNYHLLTSAHHIVSNNIQANSRGVANTITVRYNKSLPKGEDIIQGVSNTDFAIANADEEVTVKLDAALPDEDMRTQVAAFLNVSNSNLARRYALGLLLRNTKNTYKGEVVTLGNPSIKPHDVCYLFDDFNDMIGPVEVDRVTHVFTPQQGFLTEIKPSMLSHVGEWSQMHSATAMGVVMEGAIKDMFGGYATSTLGQVGGGLLSAAGAVAAPLFDYFGGFMSEAILNHTQFGFPLVLSPLSHRGRVFAGGIPTHKLPKSMWKCIFGEWTSQAQDGFDLWLEDKVDELMGTLKTLSFQNTQGQFWNNTNTLEVK